MIPAKVYLLIPKLDTPHDGELVATRDAIARLLRAAGRDWHDLAQACGSSSPSTAPSDSAPHPPRGYAPPFGDMSRACRDLDRGRLTPRERAFVADMCRRGFSFRPSPQQDAWLLAIFNRLQRRAAA